MAGTGLTRIGPYPLLARLGAGGMGTVYLALHRGLGGFEKRVAVKCLNAHVAGDAQFVGMLVDEARLTAQLSHPNIVQVIDLASSDGLHYLVMEYVEGVDARTLGAAAALALDEAAQIVADAARGLAYAHHKTDEAGRPLHIVHRDISGHNLLVSSSGATKVLDFGIAKAASNRQATEIGVLKGKLAYMSPEQALGRPLDGRSDLFSLGIVLWELCTGRRLFTGDTDMQLLLKVQRCEVEAPGRVVPGFPADLEAIILRCLAPEPADRYADGERLADDLAAYIRRAGPAEPPVRRLGRHVARYLASHPPAPIAASPAGEATQIAGVTRLAAPTPTPAPRLRVGGRPLAAAAALFAATAVALWSAATHEATPPLMQPTGRRSAPADGVMSDRSAVSTEAVIAKSRSAVSTEAVIAKSTIPDEAFVPAAAIKSPPSARSESRVRQPKPPPPRVAKPTPRPESPSPPPMQTEPPSAPAAATGFLSLNAVPWARVYVDGKAVIESTPLIRHELSPGAHKIVLVNPELKLRKELQVDIQPGEHLRESIQLR